MKVIILAGGQPSTIADAKENIPKPMVQIGEHPILWHIMKNFASYGLNEFIICAGYKVDMIKDYFNDFYIYQSDITVDLKSNHITIHDNITENWKVTIVDTGLFSSTGQRISKIQKYIDEENFIVAYGDCLSNIDMKAMMNFHEKSNKLATMAVAKPTGRNVVLSIGSKGELVNQRENEGKESAAWTNACNFIFNKKIFAYLLGNYALEQQLIKVLIEKQQISTYKHEGFWTPVETYRDKAAIETMWNAKMAPWKIWKD